MSDLSDHAAARERVMPRLERCRLAPTAHALMDAIHDLGIFWRDIDLLLTPASSMTEEEADGKAAKLTKLVEAYRNAQRMNPAWSLWRGPCGHYWNYQESGEVCATCKAESERDSLKARLKELPGKVQTCVLKHSPRPFWEREMVKLISELRSLVTEAAQPVKGEEKP